MGLKRETGNLLSQVPGRNKPYQEKRPRRIERKPYFAATPAEAGVEELSAHRIKKA